MDRRHYILIAAAAVAAGCSHEAARPFPNWVQQSPRLEAGSGSGYANYVAGAGAIDRTSLKYLGLVTFTAGQRQAALAGTHRAVGLVERGTKCQSLNFAFEPGHNSDRYAPEWRLIGRSLAWRTEDACKIGDLSLAVRYAVAATRFGFDLTAGDAAMASLGLSIADDARRAITPSIPRMGDAQLRTLAVGVQEALQGRPLIAQTLENERLNMRWSVQHVQDLFRDRKLGDLRGELGNGVAKAVAHLSELQGKGDAPREAYFEGFAAEADDTAQYWTNLSKMSAAERAEQPKMATAKSRPWQKFAQHYFSGGPALLDAYDATLARTRMLGMEAVLTRDQKAQGFAPNALPRLSELSTDPYSGKPLGYRRRGRDYELYSIGKDLKDDGGQTDEGALLPDLRLENRG